MVRAGFRMLLSGEQDIEVVAEARDGLEAVAQAARLDPTVILMDWSARPPTRLGIVQSMGRPGSALDNAVIESWHSTLEFELRAVEHFSTRAAARAPGQHLDRGLQHQAAALRAGHDDPSPL